MVGLSLSLHMLWYKYKMICNMFANMQNNIQNVPLDTCNIFQNYISKGIGCICITDWFHAIN